MSSVRTSKLELRCFGKVQELGSVESAKKSDVLALLGWMVRAVNANKSSVRKKGEWVQTEHKVPRLASLKHRLMQNAAGVVNEFGLRVPKLPAERIEGVDAALAFASQNGCPFSSIDEAFEQIRGWFEESQESFQAPRHYNSDIAAGYTLHNESSQKRMTHVALRACHIQENATIFLDIACGTGLSTKAIPKFCIGLDNAEEMLKHGLEAEVVDLATSDFVLADLSQPLPFREKSFDHALSISAVHFLQAQEKQRNFFENVLYAVKDDCCFQFFPGNLSQPYELQKSAFVAGWIDTTLFLDQSHDSNVKRWYLSLSRKPADKRKICALNFEENCSCLLQVSSSNDFSKDHVVWLEKEHARFARSLCRKVMRDENLIKSLELRKLAKQILSDFGGGEVKALEEFQNSIETIVNLVHFN